MGIYSVSSNRYVIQKIDKPEDHDFNDHEDDVAEMEDYEQDTGIEIIGKSDDLDELEDDYEDWNSMTKYQRLRSDEKSVLMFGKTNKERYDDNKAELLKLESNVSYFYKQ